MPANRPSQVKLLDSSVKIHESRVDIVWKWIGRTFQIFGVVFAGLSIYVLVIIQTDVNEINIKTRRVDRSLDLTEKLNDHSEKGLVVERLFFEADQFLNEAPEELSTREIQALIHKFIMNKMGNHHDKDILQEALYSKLSVLADIRSCLNQFDPLCDMETIVSSLNEKILSYYVYLRPVVHCHKFFKRAGYYDDLAFLAVNYGDWSSEYKLSSVPSDFKNTFDDENNADDAKPLNVSIEYDCDIAKNHEEHIKAHSKLLNDFSANSLSSKIHRESTLN